MQHATYIIDFDSTLVTVETLDELARITLASHPDRTAIQEELQAITKKGMAGEISFDESLQRRLRLFAAQRQHVAKLTSELFDHISPSALKNIAWFKQNRRHIYVISGGFEDYIKPVAERLNIDASHIFANRFIYDERENVVGYDTQSLLSRPAGKVLQLKQLSLGRPIVVIGDGYTDFEMIKHGQADEFWAYTETAARPAVITHADRVVRSFDDVARISLLRVIESNTSPA